MNVDLYVGQKNGTYTMVAKTNGTTVLTTKLAIADMKIWWRLCITDLKNRGVKTIVVHNGGTYHTEEGGSYHEPLKHETFEDFKAAFRLEFTLK